MRFSIVMPTYNRASLLRHSLPTALEQDHDDFEIVVSNNCSTDGTEQVVSELATERLRLVRPDERLSMVDHWEFAVSQARGEWLLILCDDDALLPDALTTLDGIAQDDPDCRLIQYDRFRYLYDDGIQDEGNYVEVGSRVSTSVIELDARRRLSTVFRRLSLELPKLLNATAHRSLLDDLRERHGRVFGIWAPDVSVGVRMLAATPRYLKTGPLMLWGETMESYGSGSRHDPDRILQFYRQFPEFDGTLPLSPYPELLTIGNTIFDTLSRLKGELGPEWSHLEIDPVRFRKMLLEDVDLLAASGHEQYRELATRIRADLAELSREPGRGWRRFLARLGDLPEKLRRLSAGRRSTGRKERHHFDNIHEAARFVGGLART
ncbi:MAG: glycosyltransferase family A protein [Acidobacteriota bacterium]